MTQLRHPSCFRDFPYAVPLQKIALSKNILYATLLLVLRRPSIYMMFAVMNSVKKYATTPYKHIKMYAFS